MEEYKLALDLIDKAKKGELSLEEFYNSWPADLRNEDFFQRVYDDIEGAVEHFPAKVWPRKDPLTYFRETREYKYLVVDEIIIRKVLSGDMSSHDLLTQRRYLLVKSRR